MPKKTMSTEAYISSIKTTKYLKDSAAFYLENLNLNYTQAINLFLKMIILKKGLPFLANLPNLDHKNPSSNIFLEINPKINSERQIKPKEEDY